MVSLKCSISTKKKTKAEKRKQKKDEANEKQVAKLKSNHVSSHIIYRRSKHSHG